MKWSLVSTVINPIQNLGSIIKRCIYENGKQYLRKKDLWEAIQTASGNVEVGILETLI